MRFPTVNGRRNETDLETRNPMAVTVKRDRRSGRARAMILWNEFEVGIDPSYSRKWKTGENEELYE